MDLFIDILTRVTLPIIVLAALGYLLQPWLKLDIGTLTRLQVNVVMPAFLIHFLSAGKQPLDIVWLVATLSVVQFMILIPLGWLLVRAFRMRPTLGPIMGLGTAYANVGFFGIPVTLLAFGPEYLLHQSVLTAMMTILVCTLGVWLLSPGTGGMLGKLRAAFETPLIPSVVLGLGLRFLDVELPPLVNQPLQLLGEAQRRLGSLETALATHRRQLAIAEKTVGAEHVGAANAHREIALDLEAMGGQHVAEARRAIERAIQIRAADNPTQTRVADWLLESARMARLAGDTQAARAATERAAAVRAALAKPPG